MEAFHQPSEAGEGPEIPAWNAVIQVAEKDPEHGWELILAMVPVAPEDFLTFIAVGPLVSFPNIPSNHIYKDLRKSPLMSARMRSPLSEPE